MAEKSSEEIAMSYDQLRFIMDNRRYARGKVTRNCNKIDAEIGSYDFLSRDSKLGELKELKSELKSYDSKVSSALWMHEKDRDKLDKELESCDEYQSKLNIAINKLTNLRFLSDDGAQTVSPPLVSIPSLTPSKLKLPMLPLPEFSHGKNEQLEDFLSKFENIIDKYSLSEYERFIYLEKQLSGEPLVLIKSLLSNEQSYTDAKALLMKAFASPVIQKFDVIKRLVNLSLNGPKDIYTFIGEMRTITSTFDKLNVDVNSILLYFIWNSMPESLRLQFVHIVNSNNPTLDQIQENIFEAANRYVEFCSIKKPSERREVATSYAVNIDNSYRNDESVKPTSRLCALCSGDHPIFKCDTYVTPNDKVERLKLLQCCIRCSGKNHTATNCKFRFYKSCFNCKSRNHFSYLCLARPNVDVKSRNVPRNVNLTANCGSLNSEHSRGVILPTFSVTTENGVVVRCLKDSGCTECFVKESIVKSCKFKILSNIIVNVSGMNTNQQYNTHIVEAKFELNNKIVMLNAIAIPDISINLDLPNLGRIVKAFKSRGHALADSCLNENSRCISDIGFILGSGSANILPVNDIVFGPNDACIFSSTKIGTMLYGNLPDMIKNIHYIPSSQGECEDVTVRIGSVSCSDSNLPNFNSDCEYNFDFPTQSILKCHARVGHILNCDFECISDSQNNSEEEMESKYSEMINQDEFFDNMFDNMDKSLIELTLNSVRRSEEGRLILPLVWNGKTAPFLQENFNLASSILQSLLKKYKNDLPTLSLMNEVITKQLEQGIITKVGDLSKFRKMNKCSFLPHKPVIKLNKESTKCRIVYMSNLAERNEKHKSISHNNAMLSGPCLNRKLFVSLQQLRFDSKLLVFDLVKAFLQIEVPENDKHKLCFLWFKNVDAYDFSVVAYYFNRLPFGLKCSPFLLMMGLYYILVVDTENNPKELINLKQAIWDLFYMDNGAITANSSKEIQWAFSQLASVFAPYKFDIQQCFTNDVALQDVIASTESECDPNAKLFGMNWNTKVDSLSLNKLHLDDSATTKRQILQTIASNYDPFGLSLPILNRARLFMQKLQSMKKLTWDAIISHDDIRIWKNICKQVNKSPVQSTQRYLGRRDEEYDLIAYTDSSQHIYGLVIFIVNKISKKVYFYQAKNRLIPDNLKSKSIPCLELQAVCFGVETLISVHEDLSGYGCVKPIKIINLYLFTDSLVVLNWLNSHSVKFAKMNKLSVFVRNRLNKISDLCDKNSVRFQFCEGKQNPADFVTRCVSSKLLECTNFQSGHTIDELEHLTEAGSMSVTIPSLISSPVSVDSFASVSEISKCKTHGRLYDVNRSSEFSKCINVMQFVLKFVNNLKRAVSHRRSEPPIIENASELKLRAMTHLIRDDQIEYFSDIHDFFDQKAKLLKAMPPLVAQLNVFRDNFGILRVKSKFKSWSDKSDFPILLSKHSYLSTLIIRETHSKLLHGGIYRVLTEVRKQFWISSIFSLVKRTLKECVICRHVNSRSINLNQNDYRDYRVDPSNIPFRDVFLDYIGPMSVNVNNVKTKVYLLIFSCLWSRAVNLQICRDLSVDNFLRAFQMHIFSYGLPERVFSDLGSQLTSAASTVTDFIRDAQTQIFLSENGMKSVVFSQYYKGCNKLGSLIESCVKMVKRLIYGSIRNLILSYTDFEFLISQVVHLVNRRPIAFKDALRHCDNQALPSPITPEVLLKGYSLVSLNIVPSLHVEHSSDPDWSGINEDPNGHVRQSFSKLVKARNYLSSLYHEQFLPQLMDQATDVKDRYKPKNHIPLKIGDIVLLKEPMLKPTNFQMAIVVKVVKNDLDEVTCVDVRKGINREIVKRHVSSIVPLLTDTLYEQNTTDAVKESDAETTTCKPRRAAAISCEKKINDIFATGGR